MKRILLIVASIFFVAINLQAQYCQVFFSQQVSGNQVTFTAISNQLLGNYVWDFGDGTGSTIANPVHVYNQAGIYLVCLTATIPTPTGSCTAVWCDSVSVGITPPPLPCNATFIHNACVNSGPTDVCFQSSSSTTTSIYFWDFGDGNHSTVANPSHTYAQPGIYYVCLTVTTQTGTGTTCTDTWCDSIVAGNAPPPPPLLCDASFIHNLCPNNPATGTVCFHSSTNPPNTTYFWDFGDGNHSTSANPSHLYAQPGIYVVCLTVSSQNSSGVLCTATWCDSVTVGSIPPPPPIPCNANFTYNTCNNSTTPGAVCFHSSPNVTNTTYYWDFGDGNHSTSANPFHLYAQTGIYLVCLTVTQSTSAGILCTATWCDSVTVGSIPPPPPVPCNANFTHNPCINNTIAGSICFHSSPNVTNTTYFWDFGDSHHSTSANPSHVYAQPGIYLVCLTVTQSTSSGTICTATWCDSVTVGSMPPPPPPPVIICNPNFTSYPCNNATIGANTVCFSSASNPPGTIYNWNFGDGSSSNLANPVHTYSQPGNYSVCLTVSIPGNTGTIACTATWCNNVAAVNTPNITFPNPLHPHAKFKIENADAPVGFYLFDIMGNKIVTDDKINNGDYGLPVSNIKNGIYFYRFTIRGETIKEGKLIID